MKNVSFFKNLLILAALHLSCGTWDLHRVMQDPSLWGGLSSSGTGAAAPRRMGS